MNSLLGDAANMMRNISQGPVTPTSANVPVVNNTTQRALNPLGTGGAGATAQSLQQRQLQVRRQIDDAVRYGRPVSPELMALGQEIGAV